MPGKANRKLAASAEDADGFLFSWSRKHPGTFWLWGFLILSLLLHATGFYLFQVVYPSSGRVEPFPSRVLILDEKNPANAILLQELNDRLAFLQPASNGAPGRKKLSDFSVSFRPSFLNRNPPFKKPTTEKSNKIKAAAMDLPAQSTIFPPFNLQHSLFPPVKKTATNATGAAAKKPAK